jgi:two-component system, NtrC family, sensor histidine kinase HydH
VTPAVGTPSAYRTEATPVSSHRTDATAPASPQRPEAAPAKNFPVSHEHLPNSTPSGKPDAADAGPSFAAIDPDAAGTRALVVHEGDGWLGRLAGGVVHELKNPLSTIHLNLELLRDEWARAWTASPDPKARRSLARLDVVLRETRRLDAMLKDFLRFTRADRVNREPLQLADVADEVLAFVAPECAIREIDVRREYDAGLGPVPADPLLLKQAILNLVQNAQDAMIESGGTLTIRVARGADGKTATVEVADTGIGIAAAEMPRLFELYHTTKQDGTGLGLATTKRIAEAHGGRIDVASDEGKGTRFTIVLPL